MGRKPSEKPARLAQKLTHIRKTLNLSQDGIVRLLGLESKLTREDISKYERGLCLPSLLTLLRYAQTSGVYVDTLIDDDIDLPKKLPGKPRLKGHKANIDRKKLERVIKNF
jgi:transcriptional regulator with XRE-family HTH domain